MNNVYYAVVFSPEPEDKSVEMIENAPNFVELKMNWASGIGAKLTIKGGEMFLLFPGDTLFFNQQKEFSYVLYTRANRIPKKNL